MAHPPRQQDTLALSCVCVWSNHADSAGKRRKKRQGPARLVPLFPLPRAKRNDSEREKKVKMRQPGGAAQTNATVSVQDANLSFPRWFRRCGRRPRQAAGRHSGRIHVHPRDPRPERPLQAGRRQDGHAPRDERVNAGADVLFSSLSNHHRFGPAFHLSYLMHPARQSIF